MLVSKALPFDRILESCSRFADDFMPAHLVPFTAPYPIRVVEIVATLAAKKLQASSGTSSVSVNDAELAAKAQLERFAKGLPLRDATATGPANLAVRATLATVTDPRGWGSETLP